MQFVADTDGFQHLGGPLATITWDECEALYKEGRPKLLSKLGKLGISLSDRQKFVTIFGKANKPLGTVKAGLPGGGRQQPEPHVVEPIGDGGRQMAELVTDVKGYCAQVMRDGIPDRKFGLFPPDDDALRLLSQQHCAGTKGLPTPTKDGAFEFQTAEHGWACGDHACEHGMDLRWFVDADPAIQKLFGVVRYSDYAMVGRGLDTSVHGGAVETCLDEATAECAKTKLFPLATTAKIEFHIKRPAQPNVTYRVYCEVTKEHVKGVSYDVKGEITDANDEKVVYASCVAKMANPSALAPSIKPSDPTPSPELS